MKRPDGCEDERVVLGARTRYEVWLCRGVLGLRTVGTHDDETVPTEQQRNDKEEQQKQKTWETPHPVDTVVLPVIASGAQTHGQPRLLTRGVVVRV